MTTEKLQLLTSSCIPQDEKELILKTWNSIKPVRLVRRFLLPPFSDAVFTIWLHRFVFWFSLKNSVVALLPTLFESVCRTSKEASYELDEYIDDSRAKQWNYTFTKQIMAKKINKFIEWDKAKNSYGNRAVRRPVYHYWLSVFLKDGVVKHPSPLFSLWLDTNSDDSMFTSDQIEDWDLPHLRACHWYIEMDPSKTPLHEEDNRKSVEPDFEHVPVQPDPEVKSKAEKGSRGKSKVPKETKEEKATDGSSKSTKRGAAAPVREPSKRKKVTSGQNAPLVDDAGLQVDEVAESEARSSKSAPQATKSFGPTSEPCLQTQLTVRSHFGRTFKMMILNRSISKFMKSTDCRSFESSITEVCHFISVHFSTYVVLHLSLLCR